MAQAGGPSNPDLWPPSPGLVKKNPRSTIETTHDTDNDKIIYS